MKMKIALAAIATLLLAGQVSALEVTKLRIVTEGAFQPWNFKDSSGTLKGFDVDLAKDLCQRMKVECDIQEQSWKGIIPALKAQKYDAIVAGMNATEKRRKAITFSRSYAVAQRKFYVAEDSPIKEMNLGLDFIDLDEISADEQKAMDVLRNKLKGKTVGVQTQTILESFLRKYFEEDIEIRTYDSQENLDLDVEYGRVDIGMASVTYLSPAIKDGKKYKMVGAGFSGDVFGSGISIGLRKEDGELAERFSTAINEAIVDGTVKKLSVKWFSFDLTPPL
jgi:octopine/nopaline transport system substrate-binding protein